MVRSCHLDTCPVGIATQRPELRAKFAATPEMVEAYLLYVAEEVRRLLAALGLRSLDEAVGRVDLLRRARAATPRGDCSTSRRCSPPGGRRASRARRARAPTGGELGERLADGRAAGARRGTRSSSSLPDPQRATAPSARGSAARSARRSAPARRPGRVRAASRASAGQSFGAFLAAGVELTLTGEANDYVGKGMGGGRIAIRPPADDAGDPVLVGNTVLYGATGGELFCAGRAGERFAVRNSGAVAVVEGAGDHACEYMTGGIVVVLGGRAERRAPG